MGRQRSLQSGRFGLKLIQGDAARSKLMSVSRIDIAVPEMLAKPETHGEVENEIRVGARRASRGNDRLPKLDVRLCILVDLKSDLQSFAFKAGGHRQHDIRKRGRGRHE